MYLCFNKQWEQQTSKTQHDETHNNYTTIHVHAEWGVGASFKLCKGIKLEYSHTCLHPILSDNQYAKRSKMYGGSDIFSISYEY